MLRSATIRRFGCRAPKGALCGVVVLAVSVCGAALAERPQRGQSLRETQPPRVTAPAHPAPVVRAPAGPRNGMNGQGHIAQWMEAHRGLSLEEQQRALEAEPGFRQFRPEVQQRMHEQLTQLNNMSPEQRQRAIARTEWMEQLPPERRLQVHSALSNLGALPEDRRRAVSKMFRSLRDLPEVQRNAYLNAQPVRSQFSDHERGVLNDLFAAQPYLPPAPATPPPGPQAPR